MDTPVLFSRPDLFQQPQQVPLAADLRRLLVWSQPADVSAALRLQIGPAVQATFNAVKDDRQRPGQQAGVVVRT